MDDDEPRAGEVTTPNYNWTLPTVGASDDAWGNYLNSDLLGIDSIVHSIDIRPSGVTISDTAPASPAVGALWWDSGGGQLYTFYNDGNSSQWVTASNATASLLPASTTVFGGVKVDGTTIKAAVDGTISTTVIPLGDNRIINGDMRIDQRNGGAAVAATGSYAVDRWTNVVSVASKLSFQRAPAGPSLASYGFGNYLAVNTTAAYTPAAGESFSLRQAVEADMASDFAWGTPNAQPVTLSFMFDSSGLAGTFSGSIKSYDGTRSYPFTFNCPVANVWQKVVVTIPGDTAGTWVMSGNGGSMFLCFDLGSGATFRAPAGAWASGNFIGANGAANSVGTLNNQYQLTGVKLEIGSVATPFNRQSLAKSMADCQRYYQSFPYNTYTYAPAAGGYSMAFSFPPMRAAPTMTVVSPSYGNASAVTAGASGIQTGTSTLTQSAGGFAFANYTLTLSADL